MQSIRRFAGSILWVACYWYSVVEFAQLPVCRKQGVRSAGADSAIMASNLSCFFVVLLFEERKRNKVIFFDEEKRREGKVERAYCSELLKQRTPSAEKYVTFGGYFLFFNFCTLLSHFFVLFLWSAKTNKLNFKKLHSLFVLPSFKKNLVCSAPIVRFILRSNHITLKN